MTGKPIILCRRPGLGIIENEAVSYVRYSDIPVLHRFLGYHLRKSLKKLYRLHSLHNRCAWEQLFPRGWDSHKNTIKWEFISGFQWKWKSEWKMNWLIFVCQKILRLISNKHCLQTIDWQNKNGNDSPDFYCYF